LYLFVLSFVFLCFVLFLFLNDFKKTSYFTTKQNDISSNCCLSPMHFHTLYSTIGHFKYCMERLFVHIVYIYTHDILFNVNV
jgi:hypothetical protein